MENFLGYLVMVSILTLCASVYWLLTLKLYGGMQYASLAAAARSRSFIVRCPQCSMSITDHFHGRRKGRGAEFVYDDLVVECPYCQSVALWDMLAQPPEVKKIITDRRWKGEKKSRHGSH